VEAEFAGQTAKYKDVTFQAVTKGDETDYGIDSGKVDRFQDRAACAAVDSGEERHAGACGHDMAPTMTKHPPANSSCSAEFFRLVKIRAPDSQQGNNVPSIRHAGLADDHPSEFLLRYLARLREAIIGCCRLASQSCRR